MFQYAAKLDRIIDADSVRLIVDLGFHVALTETFRLAGINAPERYTAEGKVATQFVSDWFSRQATLTVQSAKPVRQEKFGRWLAEIHGSDGTILNVELLTSGHAVPYLA